MEGGRCRHNLSLVCHISEQNTFQVKIMKKAPTRTPNYTHMHTLSNTVHQLSSSCHDCRQPGSGIYSKSIQNGPCHVYWISHQQKGQLRWWVLVGGQLKKTMPTKQTVPPQLTFPDGNNCVGLEMLVGYTAGMLLLWVGTRSWSVKACSDYFEIDCPCVIKTLHSVWGTIFLEGNRV